MRAYAIQAVLEERDRCAAMASMFSMSPQNCTVHPDVPFGAMSESAKSVAHMTAQGIAAAIRAQPKPVRDAADLLAYTPAHASAVSSGRRGFGGVW